MVRKDKMELEDQLKDALDMVRSCFTGIQNLPVVHYMFNFLAKNGQKATFGNSNIK